LDRITGGRVVIDSSRHSEGENSLTLRFLPPIIQYHMRYRSRGIDVDFGVGGGTQIFWDATGGGDDGAPLLIANDTWLRGDYPLLFTTMHTQEFEGSRETTRFEITHRPDLFPPEEIDPHLELMPPDRAGVIPPI
jgi:hypothetical protein